MGDVVNFDVLSGFKKNKKSKKVTENFFNNEAVTVQ